MAQLPPQDPSDYPYIKIGVSASVDGARELQNSALSSPVPSNLGQPLGGPGGYPWGVPAPGEHVPFAPAVPVHPSGFLWDNPVLILERRRSTNRGVAISCGIIELITVIIALIINVTLFLPTVLTEPHPSVLMGVVILMMVAARFLWASAGSSASFWPSSPASRLMHPLTGSSRAVGPRLRCRQRRS